jgi:hypothetical protein
MRYALIIGAVALALGLAGCRGYYYAEYEYPPPPEGTMVVEAPPAPLVEVVPVMPYEGAVWVAGYWHWAGHRYSWVRGRWMRPPRAGLYWYPGGYVRRGRGYVWVRGRWAGRHYRSRYRYVHPRRHWHRGYRHHGPRYRRHHPRSYRRGPAVRGHRGYRGRAHRAPPPGRGYRRHRAPPEARGAPPGKRRKRHRAPPAKGSRRPSKHRAPPAR